MDLNKVWDKYRALSDEDVERMTREDIDFDEIDALADLLDDLEGLRNGRVKAMECLLRAGEISKWVYRHLAQRNALKKWIFLDMQAQEDDELVFLALTFLGHLCTPLDVVGEDRLLPTEIRDTLGSNLVAFLIEMVAEYEIAATEEDDRRVTLVQDASVFALLAINAQFESSDIFENRVLNKLMFYQKDHSQSLAHKFIIILNRGENKLAMPLVVQMMDAIFTNKVTSKLFFFTDDLKVLVEVLLREVVNTDDLSLRIPYLNVLHMLLNNSIYPDLLHRKEDVCRVLQLISSMDESLDTFDSKVKEKAKAIISDCSYLWNEADGC